MRSSRGAIVAGLLLLVALVPLGAAVRAADSAPPSIVGKWSGTWGPLAPAGEPKARYSQAQMKLDCSVEQKDGKWQATFEGECGRPYKYTIKMEGRQAMNSVLFKGTADLGPKDGGVYDWIGRANEKEFVGFYTSAGYTGTFTLTRPKD
jgi:hypothetical protein